MSKPAHVTFGHYFEITSNTVISSKAFLFACFVLLVCAWVDISSPAVLLQSTWHSYWETLPFILLSVALASAIKVSGADALVAKVLSGRGAIVSAALFGALSPFCSCGVIPLIAGMLAAGAPLAPVMAFWLASPIIDPEMLVLTWNILGSTIAIAKLSAAVSIGLLGAWTVRLLQSRGALRAPLRSELSSVQETNRCVSSGAGKPPESPNWTFWNESKLRRRFFHEMSTLALFLSKWLLLAFLLEAVMLRWVPLESLIAKLNALGYGSIPLAALLGVPAYLNGYAAIPLMRGFLDNGLLPGAALSFMVAGGVTCIPAVVGVWGLVNKTTFAVYLSVAAIGSIAVGVCFQLLI